MSNRFRILVIALLALALAACSELPSRPKNPFRQGETPFALPFFQPPTETPFIPTPLAHTPTPGPYVARYSTAPIQRAWFYQTPHDGDLDTLLESYDVFIFSYSDAATRDELKSNGITAPMLEYLSFTAIQDPGSCTAQPFHNQAADRPGDFCTLSADHPDWFLRDSRGNLIREDPPSAPVNDYMMDPGNAGWRAFWLSRARERIEQNGWDGIFVDNAEASLDKRRQLKVLPVQYADDASYAAAVEGFFQYVSTAYFRPRGRPLMANILVLKDEKVWFRYLQYLDGIMEERFAVDWSPDYLGNHDWEQGLRLAELTQAAGKRVILVSQGLKDDTKRQQFAYASYLLVANGQASFRYTKSDSYDRLWQYDNYTLDLGQPLNPRYKTGSLWKRDFAHGTVTVDPEKHTGTITLR